jgi:hypothetical protein
MWLHVPKRALWLGSALLLGQLVWSRFVRGRRHTRAAPAADVEEGFPDTVPAVWSGFQEQASGGSDARL